MVLSYWVKRTVSAHHSDRCKHFSGFRHPKCRGIRPKSSNAWSAKGFSSSKPTISTTMQICQQNQDKKNYEAVKRRLEKRTAKKDMAEINADSKSYVGTAMDLG